MDERDNALLAITELNEAIERYEYLVDEPSIEILNEGLYNTFSKSDMKRLKTITLAKLFDYTKKEIVDEIKEKDNGKEVEDYRLPEEDRHLTINQIRTFIIANGNSDDKDAIREKVANIDKVIERSQASKKDEFKVSYGTINAFYSIYKRVKKRTLKEEELLDIFDEAECEEELNEQTYSDRKFAVKHNPKEYIAKSAHPTAGEVYKWLSPLRRLFDTNTSTEDLEAKVRERGLQRVYKIEDYPELTSLVNQIETELEKDPIDRKTVKELYKKFKQMYQKSTVKKEVRNDEKIEKLKGKQTISSLYEDMAIEDILQ